MDMVSPLSGQAAVCGLSVRQAGAFQFEAGKVELALWLFDIT